VKSVTKKISSLLLLALPWQPLCARAFPPHKQLADLERVIVLAAQEEIRSAHLENRQDVCLSLDTRLQVDEKAVLAELRRRHLMIHAEDWCIHGPRGFTISVLAPIKESSPGTFEFVVDLGDSTPITQGEDLARLVRRGTYSIQIHGTVGTETVSYRQTCCPETPKDDMKK
jgi:hypothetical protein